LVGTLALVPQIIDTVEQLQPQQQRNHHHDYILVVAARGIMDGRGLVASLALGAAGGYLLVSALWLPMRVVLFKPIKNVYLQQTKLTL
jgi:hypothetical protein